MAEKFGSRGRFILASVGAAVGLGNAFRFPGLCAKYGGGAFLLVYFIALIFLGLPLLNAEIALGRKAGGGAPVAMGKLCRGGRAIGWAAALNSLFTAIIYAGLAGWLVCEGIIIAKICPDPSISKVEAQNYFFGEVLKSRADGVISSISPILLITIAVVWALIFCCLKGGAGSISAAAKITVIAPAALIFVLALRGLCYENAGAALCALFVPDFSALSSPNLWISALGQVFFSLSLAVGIMPAYGAYLPEKTNILTSSLAIAAADACVSVVAAVALFTTLYGCGAQAEIGRSGIITAFTIYPAAIKGLFKSGAACAAFGLLFYLSLSLMAVQSASSMLEAALSPLVKEWGADRKKAALTICCAGFAACAVYATSAGAAIVETGDLFVNFYNVILLCIAECFALKLGGKKIHLCEEINLYTKKLKMGERLLYFSIGWLCPAVLLCLLVPEVVRLFGGGLNIPPFMAFAFGWGITLAVTFGGIALSSRGRRLSRL